MELADPHEPITLADGTKIDCLTGEQIKPKRQMIEVPTMRDAQDLVIKTRRKLSDLPELPSKMNGISVIISYTLFGLVDEEISVATGLALDQIKAVKDLPAYKQMMSTMADAILEADTADVSMLIKQHAKGAAIRVAELASSDDEAIALNASKDILDRSGHSAKNKDDMSEGNALRIEIINKDSSGGSEININIGI